jgi:Ca2+-binding EF-hand superfamily protein
MPNTKLSRMIATGFLTIALAAPLVAGEPGTAPPSAASQADLTNSTSPVARFRAWRHAPAAWFREREAVQMVTAIVEGSQMGPGDGWFHPGQSRYGWDWLARRCDDDRDGKITEEEFNGPAESFERLDRNGDGALKPEDFDWSESSPFVKQQRQAGSWFSRIDKSSNGRISHDEWQKFFEKLAGEKGYVSPDDLRSGLFPAPPRSSPVPPPDAEGPSREILIKGVLSGELGSVCEGPAINQRAPEFNLETQDGKRSIRLSEFRNQKPVVLVFGSFT